MIFLKNLTMRFGPKILFKDVNLQFNPGDHYGLVGANGCGKSTLIKILTKEMTPELGTFNIPHQVTLGTLKQDHYIYEQEKIIEVVLRGRPLLWEALEKKNDLLKQEELTEQEGRVLVEAEKVIAEQGGYGAESEAAKLLEGLGIQEAWHFKPLNFLSGGYKWRALLAQVLFGKPDMLVLDEPTNHLDLYSIRWLENYLTSFSGTLIVSSHDREFINGICTHIADIDYGTIKIYKGNFDAFLSKKEQEREQKEILLVKQNKKRQDIQEFIDRFKAKASKAKQAQSKARSVEKLVEEIEALDLTPSSRIYPKIHFTPFRSSGSTVLTTKGIAKSYGPKKVLEFVSFEVEKGDRLAILGPNGIGKSTLLKILTENIPLDQGEFAWGFATRWAYFPQDHQREVQENMSLLDWLGQTSPLSTPQELRGVLAQVLFSGETVNQLISTLSGGEMARLILAKMMLQKPNVLIFDEPTNHLDIEAIEELIQALKNFEGTLLFVSHNRYFVSQIANRILEITYEGIKDYKCNYAQYLEKQASDHLSTAVPILRRFATPSIQKNSDSYEQQKKQRNLKAQLKKKVEQIEAECAKIEEQLQESNATLAQEGFYQNNSQQTINTLLNQKHQLELNLKDALEKWEQTFQSFSELEQVD